MMTNKPKYNKYRKGDRVVFLEDLFIYPGEIIWCDKYVCSVKEVDNDKPVGDAKIFPHGEIAPTKEQLAEQVKNYILTQDV